MRIEQSEGKRGSLKWIQHLVEYHPSALDNALRVKGALSNGQHIDWLSPLREDKWAEYRDVQWLKKIKQVHLSPILKKFWPRRGPQWDALAKDETGRVFLFEAMLRHIAMRCRPPAKPVSLQSGLLLTH
jgi:hypothetical protein